MSMNRSFNGSGRLIVKVSTSSLRNCGYKPYLVDNNNYQVFSMTVIMLNLGHELFEGDLLYQIKHVEMILQ